MNIICQYTGEPSACLHGKTVCMANLSALLVPVCLSAPQVFSLPVWETFCKSAKGYPSVCPSYRPYLSICFSGNPFLCLYVCLPVCPSAWHAFCLCGQMPCAEACTYPIFPAWVRLPGEGIRPYKGPPSLPIILIP
jgi:hypothetical protein